MSMPALRKLETDKVKYVYFGLLIALTFLGLIIIWITNNDRFITDIIGKELVTQQYFK